MWLLLLLHISCACVAYIFVPVRVYLHNSRSLYLSCVCVFACVCGGRVIATPPRNSLSNLLFVDDSTHTMANLQQLNKDLADKSYINGYALLSRSRGGAGKVVVFVLITVLLACSFLPSHADIETLTTLPDSVDEKKFPNVARWARHIRSFTVAEQAAYALPPLSSRFSRRLTSFCFYA